VCRAIACHTPAMQYSDRNINININKDINRERNGKLISQLRVILVSESEQMVR
jgi:hypothetical protein